MAKIDPIDARIYLQGIGKVPQTVGGTVIVCPCCGKYGLALMEPNTWYHLYECGLTISTEELVKLLKAAATG